MKLKRKSYVGHHRCLPSSKQSAKKVPEKYLINLLFSGKCLGCKLNLQKFSKSSSTRSKGFFEPTTCLAA